METINLVFNLVNNLKYYLEIDMVFPEKHQSKYCFFADGPLGPSALTLGNWMLLSQSG